MNIGKGEGFLKSGQLATSGRQTRDQGPPSILQSMRDRLNRGRGMGRGAKEVDILPYL